MSKDTCSRDMMKASAICALYPKNKISKCLSQASQVFTACANGQKNGSTGVSSGDGGCSSNNTSLGASPYKKSDGIVYINTGTEIPFNGNVWNGKCYAFYINGELDYFQDSNGNYCDNEGVLTSNNFN